jgi:hypothetical protein
MVAVSFSKWDFEYSSQRGHTMNVRTLLPSLRDRNDKNPAGFVPDMDIPTVTVPKPEDALRQARKVPISAE